MIPGPALWQHRRLLRGIISGLGAFGLPASCAMIAGWFIPHVDRETVVSHWATLEIVQRCVGPLRARIAVGTA